MSDWFRGFFDKGYVSVLRDQKADATRKEAGATIRALGLPKGSRILDVGCGFGRISLELGRRGYKAVGVDLSKAMLDEARRGNESRDVTFIRGDMRRLRFNSEFDGAISIFTSFGYFSPRENEAALRGMARALRPGGRILIDIPDRVFVEQNLVPRRWDQIHEGFVLEDARYDKSTGRLKTIWLFVHPGRRKVLRRLSDLYVYDLGQLKTLFRRTGLRFLRAYGGYDLQPCKPGVTRRLIVVGERALSDSDRSARAAALRRLGRMP